MRNNFDGLKTAALLGTVAALSGCAVAAPATSNAAKPNILFIVSDDLRPALGCYGDTLAKTPNIDRLAQSGTTLMHAYCQQAVCSPSRTSLLTGLRPDTTRIYDLETSFRASVPDAVTLPQYFKNNGYFSVGMGKIFHDGLDDEPSWSVPSWTPKAVKLPAPQAAILDKAREKAQAESVLAGNPPLSTQGRGAAASSFDVPDNLLSDGMTADHAIETLRGFGAQPKQPFFLAVGFAKPHLPFEAPKKYWDRWQRSDFALPATYGSYPRDMPSFAGQAWGEMRSYAGIPAKGPVSDAQALQLIHGYYAAASYMDAQVGRVLDELDRLKLRDNTIIVFWGDHGYQLGDHSMWAKHSNFESATHSPLLISVPGQTARAAKANGLVEFVDVYPTLCELAGLPPAPRLDGLSLVPILKNPQAPGKAVALSQYPRNKNTIMGYSMRTDRYRFTQWIEADTKNVTATELYDHQTDPQENVNAAALPQNKILVSQLETQLRGSFPALSAPGPLPIVSAPHPEVKR